MRYLNKIVFINSASIRFEEILLDGNVHLVGTQGVGKSTVLRAILFFYNGDTQKLGISREKKLFAEYYFQHIDSYIIYEVQRETGPFCIVVMRSGTGVQFRFVDCAFEQGWIIKDHKAMERWADIRQVLDKRGIDSSNRIDRLQEYRDILYGNTSIKPAYRKYCLIESKQYQNIPRTITNVFLNTNLEARFIKETIINSLSEEELVIDLIKYRHHLGDFEREFEDIQKFKKPRTKRQAEKVIEAYNGIIQKRNELKLTASKLSGSLNVAKNEQKKLKISLDEKETEKHHIQENFERQLTTQQDEINTIARDIKIIEDNIAKANNKEQEYHIKGIHDILARSQRKVEWESQLLRLTEENKTLITHFESIDQKFEVQVNQMKNNQEQLINERRKAENEHRQQFQELKDKLIGYREEEIKDLRNAFDENIDQLAQKEREKRYLYAKVLENRAEIRERNWRSEEILEVERSIQEAFISSKEAEREQIIHEEKIKQLKNDWKRAEEKLSDKTENSKTELRAKLVKNEESQFRVQSKLVNYKDTLYAYLQENYPDWQQSIGKVAREEILFSENLKPELKEDTISLFYSVKLNLDEVNVSAKSIEQYESEKIKLEEQLNSLKKELADLDVQQYENIDRLKKSYQPKIREHKNQIQRWRLEQSHQQQLEEKNRLELEELQQNAKEEKQKELDIVNNKVFDLEAELLKFSDKQTDLRNKFESTSKMIMAEFESKLNQAKENLDERQKENDEFFSIKQREIENRIKNLNAQKLAELKGAGADTERLAVLKEQIQVVKSELNFIEDNREFVFGYNKDKNELFDRVHEFRKQLKQKHENKSRADQILLEHKQLHINQLRELDDALSSLKERLKKIDDGLQDFAGFSKSDRFQDIYNWFHDNSLDGVSAYQVRELISALRNVGDSLKMHEEDLRDATNRFLNNFSDVNLFKFRTSPNVQRDYMDFATNLVEFIDENKIAEYERRVKERFAKIISIISNETSDLISREGEIQKLISKVNGDFRARNFVGVIQSMELKIDNSENRVVRTLKRIRDYEQEHGFELGEQNIFNIDNKEDHNQRAVEFLRQLSRDINEAKQERVRLSDAFELRFRVIENDNDSGWVEKLSNVGSEGTDVLVKAMLNILLLNVFKNSASRKFRAFRLHCMMDEIGRLHPTNVRGILKFANDRNILLINGSPVEQDAMAYRHIYELRKDNESHTRIRRLVSVNHASPSLD